MEDREEAGASAWTPRKGKVTKVVTPVTKREPANAAELDSCIRAENEDDDGYDPYSDRVEHPTLFERDPWS